MVQYKLKILATTALSSALIVSTLSGFTTSVEAATKVQKAKDVKFKKGKLVKKSNGKVIKGYVSYKGVIYKDGNTFTGILNKYYFKKGKKATGLYNSKYYKNGSLGTGIYKKHYYKSGIFGTGTYKSKKYSKGKLLTGLLGNTYYKNGVLGTGTYKSKKYSKGKLLTGLLGNTYYENGVLGTGLYEDHYYLKGKLGNGEFEGVLYEVGKPFTGEKDGVFYQDGKKDTNQTNIVNFKKAEIAVQKAYDDFKKVTEQKDKLVLLAKKVNLPLPPNTQSGRPDDVEEFLAKYKDVDVTTLQGEDLRTFKNELTNYLMVANQNLQTASTNTTNTINAFVAATTIIASTTDTSLMKQIEDAVKKTTFVVASLKTTGYNTLQLENALSKLPGGTPTNNGGSNSGGGGGSATETLEQKLINVTNAKKEVEQAQAALNMLIAPPLRKADSTPNAETLQKIAEARVKLTTATEKLFNALQSLSNEKLNVEQTTSIETATLLAVSVINDIVNTKPTGPDSLEERIVTLKVKAANFATNAVNALFAKENQLIETITQTKITYAKKLVNALTVDSVGDTTKTDLVTKVTTAQNILNTKITHAKNTVDALFATKEVNHEAIPDYDKLAPRVIQSTITEATTLVDELPKDVAGFNEMKLHLASADTMLQDTLTKYANGLQDDGTLAIKGDFDDLYNLSIVDPIHGESHATTAEVENLFNSLSNANNDIKLFKAEARHGYNVFTVNVVSETLFKILDDHSNNVYVMEVKTKDASQLAYKIVFTFENNRVNAQFVNKTEYDDTDLIATTKVKIDNLFSIPGDTILKENTTQQLIDEAKTDATKIENVLIRNELIKRTQLAQNLLIIREVNALFDVTTNEDSSIVPNYTKLASGVNSDKILAVEQRLTIVTDLTVQNILKNHITTAKSLFESAKKLQQATTAVNLLFDGNELKEDVIQNDINTVNLFVLQLTDSNEKQTLLNKISSAQIKLIDRIRQKIETLFNGNQLAEDTNQTQISTMFSLVNSLNPSHEQNILLFRVNEAQMLFYAESAKLQNATDKVNALFNGQELANDVTQMKINEATSLVGALINTTNRNNLLNKISDAQSKLIERVTSKVNELFNGSALADGVTQTKINNAKPLVEALNDSSDKTALLTKISDAQNKLVQLATTKVDALFNGNVLANGVTQANINDAKSLVESLNDSGDKTNLLTKISNAETLFNTDSQNVNNAINAINELFTDSNRIIIRDSISEEQIIAAQSKLYMITNYASRYPELNAAINNATAQLNQATLSFKNNPLQPDGTIAIKGDYNSIDTTGLTFQMPNIELQNGELIYNDFNQNEAKNLNTTQIIEGLKLTALDDSIANNAITFIPTHKYGYTIFTVQTNLMQYQFNNLNINSNGSINRPYLITVNQNNAPQCKILISSGGSVVTAEFVPLYPID